MGKTGCLGGFSVYCLTIRTCHECSWYGECHTEIVSCNYWILLHKIIGIVTICDQNISRACAGHHLVYKIQKMSMLAFKNSWMDWCIDKSAPLLFFFVTQSLVHDHFHTMPPSSWKELELCVWQIYRKKLHKHSRNDNIIKHECYTYIHVIHVLTIFTRYVIHLFAQSND